MAVNRRSVHQLVILTANSFLCFGSYFLFDSLLSFQPFLLGTPCSAVENTTVGLQSTAASFNVSCCEECLNFNPLEYNVLIGLPVAASTIVGFVAGYIVDKHGFRVLTIVSGLMSLAGAAVRAAGTRTGLSHGVRFSLILIGGTIVDNVFAITFIVQLYICTRWFSGKYHSLALGVSLAISLSGSVLAYYMNVPLSLAIGIEATFWVALGVAGITLLSSVVLVIADCIGERNQYKMTVQQTPPDFSIASLRTISKRFWLVAALFGDSFILFCGFAGNAVAMQYDIYGSSPKTAAFSSGLMFIAKIVFSPVAGAIGSHFDIRGPVGVVGCLCNLAGLTMLSSTAGPPIVIIVLMGLGFVATYVSMTSVVTDLVPFEKLATANAILNASLCLSTSIGHFLIGAMANSAGSRRQGWLWSAWFLLSVAVLQTLTMCALFVGDSRSPKRVLYLTKRVKAELELDMEDEGSSHSLERKGSSTEMRRGDDGASTEHFPLTRTDGQDGDEAVV